MKLNKGKINRHFFNFMSLQAPYGKTKGCTVIQVYMKLKRPSYLISCKSALNLLILNNYNFNSNMNPNCW